MTERYFATGKDDPALVETLWPCPGERLSEVNDRLRWNDSTALTREDLLVAASVISAYCALIEKPTRMRNKYASALKRVAARRAALRAERGP